MIWSHTEEPPEARKDPGECHSPAGSGLLGQPLTCLVFSFSFCFFSWLAGLNSPPCLWHLFFHPQQNYSHQGNWWWGVWEKQELLHWDDGPPHGGSEFSERCSTWPSSLTLTFFSPLCFFLSSAHFSPPPTFSSCLSGSLSWLSCLALSHSLFTPPLPLSAPSSILTNLPACHMVTKGGCSRANGMSGWANGSGESRGGESERTRELKLLDFG